MIDERLDVLGDAWRENLCGDQECEQVRLEAALMVLKGHSTDHRFYARVVVVGKEEIEDRASQLLEMKMQKIIDQG